MERHKNWNKMNANSENNEIVFQNPKSIWIRVLVASTYIILNSDSVVYPYSDVYTNFCFFFCWYIFTKNLTVMVERWRPYSEWTEYFTARSKPLMQPGTFYLCGFFDVVVPKFGIGKRSNLFCPGLFLHAFPKNFVY